MQEPSDMTLEHLEEAIADEAEMLSRRIERWLSLVAEFDARAGALEWGFRSTADWLAWRCGLGGRAARDHVRVARRLSALPLTKEAFASGALSYSKVRAIARASHVEDEDGLVELARTSSAAELEQAVRSLRSAPSAGLDVINRAHEQRYMDWWWDTDGSLRFSGRLSPDEGAALIEALESGAEALHPVPIGTDDTQPRPSLASRRADALTEIVFSGSPRAQITLHVDPEALACTAHEVADRRGEVCHLEAGPAIPSETARRLSCDGEILNNNLGRSRRVVSPALRTSLERRDRGCRFPGCTRRHGIHAHHIEHWAHGGRTDRDNLVLLCRFHHRLVHEAGFLIQRDHGSLSFNRPDGRAVPTVPTLERAPPAIALAA